MLRLEVPPLVPVVGPRAEAAGLPQAAQKAAVKAVPPSAAARVPFPVRAPEAAQRVQPEASARQARGLLRAARHEAQPGVAEVAAPTDAGVAAEEAEAAEPDVAVVAEVELPVVPAEPPSGPPSAAAWVFRQGRVLPWPAPPRLATTARAMELSPVAWPSERSWQAALVVVLSCALGPGNSEGEREIFG